MYLLAHANNFGHILPLQLIIWALNLPGKKPEEYNTFDFLSEGLYFQEAESKATVLSVWIAVTYTDIHSLILKYTWLHTV
jgi:Na+/pantothenate symporter